jgi:uncharacterized protein YecT (DUF1311 family)
MKFLGLVLFIALAPSTSSAQNSAQYRACNEKAQTQAQMNACANDEAARVDVELDRVYAELVSKAEVEPNRLTKIKAAETAWTGYRNAYIDAMYPANDKQAEYGSVYPMEVDLLLAKLTRQQITALRELLQQFSR